MTKNKSNKTNKKLETVNENYMAIGMSLGMSFGIAIGTIIGFATNNVGVCMCFGVSIGMSLGMGIGSTIKKNNKK